MNYRMIGKISGMLLGRLEIYHAAPLHLETGKQGRR